MDRCKAISSVRETAALAQLTFSGHRPYTIESRVRAVERVITAMCGRLDETISLEEMARIAYISPFHFDRIFRQVTGIPPFRFLYALRLATAKHLLLMTDRSVTDVCFEVGYNSLGTFTSRFTQLVGLSPCRFRHLADRFLTDHLHSWLDGNDSPLIQGLPKHSVFGRIDSPFNSSHLIFVGLFHSCMPEGVPVAGTLLTGPGPFQMVHIPDGHYVALAAAFPNSNDPLAYLLPASESLLVGVSQSPIRMEGGTVRAAVDITLRPMRITDPPILVALPHLLKTN